MSFLRRKKSDDKADAAAAPPEPDIATSALDVDDAEQKPAKEKKERKNPIQGLRDYIIDSYRGLYKIVLEPSMPSWSFVGLALTGVIIGLIWGWNINPPVFTGANPNRMSQEAQDQWIKMTAVGFDNGSFYSDEEAIKLLQMVDSPQIAIQRMIQSDTVSDGDRAALQNLLPVAEQVQAAGTFAVTPRSPGILQEVFAFLLPLIIVAVATPIVVVVWRMLFYPNIIAPIQKAIRMATDKEFAEATKKQMADLKRLQDQKAAKDAFAAKMKADQADSGPPVMTQVSPFIKGREYDDSFEIELGPDQGNAFLGQSGALIAESVAPDPVAVEVWLFDIFSSQNLNKIFISEQAYNDPSIRGRLEGDVDNPATDLIPVSEGSEMLIESDKLRLKATMTDVQYDGSGRFESFQMQMVAYQKEAAGGGAPVAAADPLPAMPASPQPLQPPPMQMPQSPQPPASPQPLQPPPMQMPQSPQPLQPPPMQMPQSPQPPASPQPLQPPPMQMPQSPQPPASPQPLQPPPLQMPPGFGDDFDEDDDDDEDIDPFGGTGDFTPLSR